MRGILFVLIVAVCGPLTAQNLLDNPSFDSMRGWDAFWSRDAGQGSARPAAGRSGPAVELTSTGGRDWAFASSARLPVKSAEGYTFSALVKHVSGQGTLQLSVELRSGDQVTDWLYAVKTISQAEDWTPVQSRFLVPPGTTSVQFRFTGEGAADWLAEAPSLVRTREALPPALDRPITVSSRGLSLTLDARRLTLTVPTASYTFDTTLLGGAVTAVQTTGGRITLTLADASGAPMTATIEAMDGFAELSIAGGGLDADFPFPGPLTARHGQSWVLPLNEGLLVPAELPPALKFNEWVLYSGHGLCMPFVGLTDGRTSLLVLAETPDDAKVRLRTTETSALDVVWQPSKGAWRYERRLRLVPVNGDYVAVAKAYRAYAETKGLVVTLKQKAAQAPQVDRLVGAVDLWYWKDAPHWTRDNTGAIGFAGRLKAAGIDRVLWSQQQAGPVVSQMNELGFLTGRYDIYQDVWGPDNPDAWENHDGWPDDLVLDAGGRPVPGWVDRGAKDYVGGVISSGRSLVWEQKKVPADLADHPYGARFLDTVTASPLREDWSPAHPLTRSEDKANKFELLDWLAREKHLVVGSETGFDFAVPALHYFEGMMSIAPFRLPDSGYDLTGAKTPSPEFREFQLGPQYRIPLFELVYHDCVVSYWYWGDSSNRVPELWDERDLFNALYGTGPLWIVDPKIWSQYESRFVQSFQAASVSRHTGYSEMLSHEFLTPDHTVQRTTFADGTVVTADFGKRAWRAVFPDGTQAGTLTP